jgi:hypothetical protein
MFVTPAFLENFFTLGNQKLELPKNFDFANFIFSQNEHRLT